MAAGGMGGGGEDDEVFADINVTPLVDVVLVLLLIFMVTAPMLAMTMDVNLPEVSTASPASPTAVVVTVNEEGAMSIDERVLSLDEIVAEATRQHEAGHGAVYLRADRDVPYHFVVSVLDGLRAAGLEEVSLVTAPLPVSPAPAPDKRRRHR